MTFREIEKIILADGWQFKKAKGSHYSYIHPTKPGQLLLTKVRSFLARVFSKVTIPHHNGDIDPVQQNLF